MAALVALEQYWFITNMWAVIDYNSCVIDCIAGVTLEEAQKQKQGFTLIPMTLKNSPAFIGAIWNGKTFSEEKI